MRSGFRLILALILLTAGFVMTVNASSPATAGATLSLNGTWRIAFDSQAAWRGADGLVDWASVDSGLTQSVSVPGVWETIRPDYDGVGWYRREVDLSAEMLAPGRRAFLRFGAANYLAEVWVNRASAGRHEGGYTPFEFDVAPLLRPGRNVIDVRVLNPDRRRVIDGLAAGGVERSMKDIMIPIGKQIRYDLNFGGLWQEVSLRFTGRQYLADIYLRPFINPTAVEARMTLAGLESAGVNPAGGRVDLAIRPATGAGPALVTKSIPWSGAEPVSDWPLPVAGRTIRLDGRFDLPGASLWSPDRPVLYVCEVVLWDAAGREMDRQSVRFGLRELTERNGHLWLNGRPFFVKGAYSQGFYPITMGAPPDDSLLRQEIALAKKAHINLMRMHIKTPHPRLLDLADEMGMVLYNESSIGWMQRSPRLEELCRREVREMILRDRNHASVGLWGLINEKGRHVFEILPALVEEARRWDDSRLLLQDSGRTGPVPSALPGRALP